MILVDSGRKTAPRIAQFFHRQMHRFCTAALRVARSSVEGRFGCLAACMAVCGTFLPSDSDVANVGFQWEPTSEVCQADFAERQKLGWTRTVGFSAMHRVKLTHRSGHPQTSMRVHHPLRVTAVSQTGE